MSNDFDFFQTDDDDELPDWLTGAAEFEEQEEAPMPEAAPMPELADEPPLVAAPLEDMPEEDEFDLLRERSALASEIYDDFQVEELAASGGGILSMMTPSQRFLLALLFLLNVAALAIFVLVYAGVVELF